MGLISGVVRDANGNPVAGKLVRAYRRDTGTLLGWTQTSTGSDPVDPHAASVSSLLHFDGSDGSTVFADETGKVWSANGNAKISTALSKFGGASAYFDGNGDYLATPESSGFGFEAGDFTVEAWICPVGILGSDRGILDFRYSGSGAGGTLFLDNSQGGRLAFWNNTAKFGAVGSVPALNQWVHVALSLSEGVLRGFLNGVQQWSASHGKNLGAKSVLGIGGSAGVGLLGTSPFHGYVDEVRITKGLARYTENFTPPIVPFTLTAVSLALGAYQINTGSYSGVCNIVALDDNLPDLILRTTPV